MSTICDKTVLVWTKDENGDYHGTGTILGVTVDYVVSRYGRKDWSLVRDLFYGFGGGSFAEAKKQAQDDFAWRCRCPEEWIAIYQEIGAELAHSEAAS